MWNQVYDPLNSKALSTIAAALPVVTLLVLIASNKVKAHWAAIVALGAIASAALINTTKGDPSNSGSSPEAGQTKLHDATASRGGLQSSTSELSPTANIGEQNDE